MSQVVGLGIPLSSNNRANLNTPLSLGSGNTIAGVQSLNALAGNLTIVGDASVDVTNIGGGQIQVSTSGNPQNFGAVTCSSVAASGSVTAGGAVSGASVTATGAVNGATVATSGNATIGGALTTSNLVATGSATVTNAPGTFFANAATGWGSAVTSGSETIAGTLANGATVQLTALNNLIADVQFRNYARFVIIHAVIQPVTPFANGIPNSMYSWQFPAYQSGTGLGATTTFNQNNSLIQQATTVGGLGQRVTTFAIQNVSGIDSTTAGLTYFWNLI